ncbi:MAG: NAD(P)-binding domain-containing protein [Planctomycetota bacterium]|nr:NAD(P)-binding domain-containing protein [Planctomycetota bacterium]
MDNQASVASVLANRYLGLLGAGNMAEALVRGVIDAGAIPASRIMVSDVSPERRALRVSVRRHARARGGPGRD